jgi:hypothetical protein
VPPIILLSQSGDIAPVFLALALFVALVLAYDPHHTPTTNDLAVWAYLLD